VSVRELGAARSGKAGPLGITAVKLCRVSVESPRMVKLKLGLAKPYGKAQVQFLTLASTFYCISNPSSKAKGKKVARKVLGSSKAKQYPIHYFHSWKWLDSSC